MNDFHKLRENFNKFLNEGPNDLIPGYPNTSYDEINNAHEGLKKALLDVSRASLANAAYGYGYDASQAGDFAMEKDWKKYLKADLNKLMNAGMPSTGVKRNYRNEKFWKDTKLGGENGLLYYFHENADNLASYLEGQLNVAERDLDGKDLNDEKVKEKYKGVMLKIEAIKKAIEEVKKYKAVLDATGGKHK